MLVRIFRAVLMTIVLLGVSQSASSQMVRVNLGSNDSGGANYIDAYKYDYVQEKPSFPGGEAKLTEFINANRQYPREAYKKGIQGRVTCWFIVNTDGSVSNVSLLRSVNELLNEEALRVFNLMPDWQPGRINGIPVPVMVVRSIRFRK